MSIKLLKSVPSHANSETIVTLWPLLERLLPHIRRDQRGLGWRSPEEYIAKEIDRDPVRVIKFYQLMHMEAFRPQFYSKQTVARTIIKKAEAHSDSRKEALSLINTLARILRKVIRYNLL